MATFIDQICRQCGKAFQIEKRQLTSRIIKGAKEFFCSQECNSIFRNRNYEKKVVRRSKFELWLETRLKEEFPNLEIVYRL